MSDQNAYSPEKILNCPNKYYFLRKITTSFEQITNSSEKKLPFFRKKKAYLPEQILIRPHKCYIVLTDNSFDRRNFNLSKQIRYSSLLEAYSSEQIYT